MYEKMLNFDRALERIEGIESGGEARWLSWAREKWGPHPKYNTTLDSSKQQQKAASQQLCFLCSALCSCKVSE